MSKQQLIQNVPAIIPIVFDFSAWNKTHEELEEVKIVFKFTEADADNLYLEKTYTAVDEDLEIVDSENKFLLKINQEDFEKLKPSDKGYFLRLGLKFIGDISFRDAGELENNLITVAKSWFTDNI